MKREKKRERAELLRTEGCEPRATTISEDAIDQASHVCPGDCRSRLKSCWNEADTLDWLSLLFFPKKGGSLLINAPAGGGRLDPSGSAALHRGLPYCNLTVVTCPRHRPTARSGEHGCWRAEPLCSHPTWLRPPVVAEEPARRHCRSARRSGGTRGVGNIPRNL